MPISTVGYHFESKTLLKQGPNLEGWVALTHPKMNWSQKEEEKGKAWCPPHNPYGTEKGHKKKVLCMIEIII